MSDVKISALPSAGSLTGSEVVPIVQGGATKQVALSSIVGLVDLSPYIKKDGSVLWTGDDDHNGHNIKNVALISGVSGGEIDLVAATDFTQGWISAAPTYAALGFNNVGQVKVDNSGISIFSVVSGKTISLSTPGAVDIASSGDNVNIESTTGDINLISHGYTAKLPSSAPGTNTYLKYNGSNYVWASASGSSTLSALTDVNLTSVANGDLLKYDSGTSKWINFTPSYLTANQTITLSGDVSGSGSTSITTTIGAGKVTNSMLAGSIADGKLASSYLYADGTRGLTGAWYNTQNASFSMLGVGTGSTAPSATLHTVETGTTSPRGVIHDQYNTGTNSSQVNLRKGRGTFASPTVITTGDILSNLNTWAYDGSGFINSAAIRVTSVGTIGTGRTPSKMEFMTMTDVTTGVLTTALTLDQNQNATFAGTISGTSLAISGTGGSGYVSLTAQSSAPTISAGDTKMYLYADSSTRFSLAKRNAADSSTITRTFVFNDASVTYTFPSSNTDTLAGLGTAQSFTAQQTFTGSSIQVPSVSILDTTYKTVLDIAGSNQVRVGNGFATTVIQSTTLVLTGTTIQPSTTTTINPAAGSTPVGVTISRQANITNVGTAFKQLSITGNYAPASSGVGTFVGISLDSTINETSTANQVITMVDINPTLTSVQASLYGLRSRIAASPTGGGTAWNIYADGTASNYIAGNTGIGTNSLGTAFLTLAAATTAKAAINFVSGSAPTSPNNGDFWFDGTNVKIQVGGVTKTFTLT